MKGRLRRTRARLDDAALVGLVHEGDERAFAVLADRHGPWLTQLCTRHLGGDVHAAQDVVQETLIKAHAAIVRGTKPLRLHAWLAVVARHGCMDEHRRRRPTPTDSIPDQPHVDDDPFAMDPHLEEAWEALTQRHREVLHHRELLGLSYQELAVVMDTTVSSIETLLYRARAALRREYQRAGGRLLGCGFLGIGLLRLADNETSMGAHHLASCAECQDAATSLAAVGDLLRGTIAGAPVATTPGLLSATSQRLGALAANAGELPSQLLQGTHVAVGATFAAAAFMGAVIGLGASLSGSPLEPARDAGSETTVETPEAPAPSTRTWQSPFLGEGNLGPRPDDGSPDPARWSPQGWPPPSWPTPAWSPSPPPEDGRPPQEQEPGVTPWPFGEQAPTPTDWPTEPWPGEPTPSPTPFDDPSEGSEQDAPDGQHPRPEGQVPADDGEPPASAPDNR